MPKKKDLKEALQPIKAGDYKMMYVPKVDRAKEVVKKNGGDPEDMEKVLVEYDRLGGLVLDKEGKRMPYKFFVEGKHLKVEKKAKSNKND